jgi:xanthine dehydrogenase accessory factor
MSLCRGTLMLRHREMFDEFLSKATALRSAECPFAVAVVVRCQPPVSGKPGDKAIIQPDGTVWGWIGGGCVQPLVIQEARKAIEDGSPRLIRIAPSRGSESEEGIVNYTMTCHGGGALDVYIEPILSKPLILIVGRSLTAQVLCKLGKAIGYRVSVVAPGATRERFPDADLIIDELDLSQVKITPETYVVVSTQGEHDEEALEQALRANTSYVSFIASVLKARKVFDFLITKGLAPESLSRIKAPAGLNIGASSSQEIAVSILAEIVQARKSKMTALDIEDVPVDKSALVNAQDPVCGMAVETNAANYVSEYKGKTFYFCCGGCKQTFDKQPEVYA